MNPIKTIRACQYLYLHHIGEPEENTLRLVLHEARLGSSPSEDRLNAETSPGLRKILSESRAIEHGPGCKIFEVVWDTYIGYSVLNESYASPEPETSQGEGRLFVEYTTSVFLDYLSRATFASTDYPGPFKHRAVYCLNHSVDIASTREPKIVISTAI